MADLKSLAFTTSTTASSTNFPTEFIVYNTSICSQSNGGQCCQFTAPAGTTWVTFEIWGGGGGGPGSCCCQSGFGGGSGAYAVKSLYTGATGGLAGQSWTICAGGSTGATPGCSGCTGYSSWVQGYGLSNFCAGGGCCGFSTCWQFFSCYTGCNVMCCCAQACGGDLMFPGYSGGEIQTQFCGAKAQGFAAVAPATVSGPWTGPHGCQWGGCTSWGTGPYFPGGGGRPGIGSANNCCCGEMGAGGLVSVTYG